MIARFVHTRAFKWLLALLFITIFLVSYAASGREYIKDTTIHGNALSEKERVNYENITVAYEKGMPEDILEQCRMAISKMPVLAVKQFIEDDWKIVVSSTITMPDYANVDVMLDNTSTVIGITDYNMKSVTVLCNEDQQSVTIPLAHELCHYCDHFFGDYYYSDPKFYTEPQEMYLASFTDEFMALYEEYKDSYIEFEKSGIERSAENELDFKYPVSNQIEFFACAYKDYLLHPDYIKDYYRGLYTYFQRLNDGNITASVSW